MMEQREQFSTKWYAALTKLSYEEHRGLLFEIPGGGEGFHPKLVLPISNKSSRQVLGLFPNYIFESIDVLSSDDFQVG